MPVYANALIDAVALTVVLVVIVADRRINLPLENGRRIFYALLTLIAGVLLFDIPAWLLDGVSFPGSRTICLVLDTLYYACQIGYCYFWLLFADCWTGRRGKHLSRGMRLAAIPMFLELAIILANPFTGWLFTIDANNVYARGSYYLINLIPYYLYIAASLVLAVRGFFASEDVNGKRRGMSLVLFMLLPLCGAVLEALFYGITWLWPFSALSLLMIYLNAQQQQMAEQQMAALRQAEEAAKLKNELTNSRIAIMLSQMQPHFLYNALSSIKALCTRDPELAAQAAGDFAEFLRNNMDSLTDDKPVSFLVELEHTKHYLALELIRFRDRLHVEYDIQADLFRLPTLSLQPIVENAVRYGTMQRIEGGTVSIASAETDTAFVVTVTDDGVGFDPSQKKEDGRTHIGLQNVEYRLRSICGGTLVVESTLGAGTVATITIPKGEPCSY